MHPRGQERGWDAIKTRFYEQTMAQTFAERKLTVKDLAIHSDNDAHGQSSTGTSRQSCGRTAARIRRMVARPRSITRSTVCGAWYTSTCRECPPPLTAPRLREQTPLRRWTNLTCYLPAARAHTTQSARPSTWRVNMPVKHLRFGKGFPRELAHSCRRCAWCVTATTSRGLGDRLRSCAGALVATTER